MVASFGIRNARQSLPAASLRTANRLPAGRVMRLVYNHLICFILSSIGPAIFRRQAKFLPALREAAGPAVPLTAAIRAPLGRRSYPAERPPHRRPPGP